MIFFSPSDLDADDEDNQNQSDSTVSSLVQVAEQPARARPGTPTGDTALEVKLNCKAPHRMQEIDVFLLYVR